MLHTRDHVLWSIPTACTQALSNAIETLQRQLCNVERVFQLVACRLKQ